MAALLKMEMSPLKQAVILAAGASTRTHPLTLDRPKPLLPLLNKPILQHTLEQLNGLVEEVILVVGYRQGQMRDFFGDRFSGLRLTYCVQEEQRGTGHALRQASAFVSGRFLLLNGDDLVHRRDLEAVASYRYGMLGAPVKDPRPFGVLELDEEGCVANIIEKPEHFYFQGPALVNTGVFVFQPDVFEILAAVGLSRRGEYELVDIVRLLPPGDRCRVAVVQEYWLPVGYPWNLLEANRFLLERSANTPPRLDGVSVEPPVIVGSGSTVEPGCTLGPGTTIGRDCHVAGGSCLENCLVMDGVTIGSGCLLRDTIVCDGVLLEAGVVTQTEPETGATVLSAVKGRLRDTGRSRLGAVIGTGAHVGRGSLLHAGVKVWPGLHVAEGATVRADVEGAWTVFSSPAMLSPLNVNSVRSSASAARRCVRPSAN